ncbi:MAG: hypothetical protein AUG06_12425 [Actinobacteria bacterium 13_1_20CM_2_65_11]|nr:MAG: hypothetical protein AUH40_05150 [Chloroflexi bacterium 13_1_40CM_65_17]OLC67287.1 MAG: hypothetical protein AUH69_04905 [Actinobacteria bacterium 13_1_40CM_4_65_12]OLD25242.1 MAG: hypothetical protein AUJ02_05600 [Chloroflexi bacterium 13_1_40CM_3_65_12]OLD48534.1 MAG: hypothetical protein AUI42_12180 [Actinobacteria bacterium 13_1_40CM_2_65_8]OLE77964.1 MAG: hypothetical protein AUG06_12425 [Actinobacteria bacterium 13_1_20CM_2_65_11]
MDRITEAFVWPVRDPEWIVKLLIIGLISLIPIVGVINAIGWMLASLDRLRAGDERLAPANLSYLPRGVRVFVVELVYTLVIAAIGAIFYIPGVLIAVRQGHDTANPGLIGVAILLNLVAFGAVTLGSLAYTFALPAFVLATDAGGIAAGLRVGDVVRRCRVNPISTLIAGLMLIAASFISTLGVIACGIGVFFTAAYALAMQAWIIHSFEVGSTAPKAG